MVELLRDQQEQEKLKQLRISQRLLLVNVLCLIAQMVWIIYKWQSSLRDLHLVELGVVSMSSIVLS
jgi:hypothetical protein